MEIVSDMNNLYDAFLLSMKGSSWKEEPQRFEIDFLSEIRKLQIELEEKTYKTSTCSEFELNERGRIRLAHGGRMRDRVVRHTLCDDVLTPALEPYLIHNNGASQKGKGIDFARKNFEEDLHNFWLEHHSNNGWVGFMDLSKFYDNILHDGVRGSVNPKIDDFSAWLLDNILSSFQIDVSYMSDKEYSECLSKKFDSLEYYETIPNEWKTGEKYMEKSVDIGDQTAQNIGVYYPTPIDNYIANVCGFHKDGRYMDDIYMIHENRECIKETMEGVKEQAEKLGLFINEKKTRICHLSETFKYLQIKYFLADTGKVVKRINPKSVTRERRKLKAYKRLLNDGKMTYPAIEQAYRSWMGSYARIMSKEQIEHMKGLYMQLYGKDPRWKKRKVLTAKEKRRLMWRLKRAS